jgi:hypothetical protein
VSNCRYDPNIQNLHKEVEKAIARLKDLPRQPFFS